MANGDELRITQIKAVQEGEKRKHSLEMEELRHKHALEELKFMAKNKITSYGSRMQQFPGNIRKKLNSMKKEDIDELVH